MGGVSYTLLGWPPRNPLPYLPSILMERVDPCCRLRWVNYALNDTERSLREQVCNAVFASRATRSEFIPSSLAIVFTGQSAFCTRSF